jgi:hypothetical protein
LGFKVFRAVTVRVAALCNLPVAYYYQLIQNELDNENVVTISYFEIYP